MIRTVRRSAFTLVELLVVIGIIALLISILMPALSRARRQSQMVACQANLRQIGMHLIMYGMDNNGQVIPLGPGGQHLGGGVAREERWPTKVFKPPRWNHPVLLCPSDLEPGEEHSYVLNIHLVVLGIRFGATKGVPATKIIVAGEKKSEYLDYHMDPGQFDTIVEQFRHGLYVGSNYLYLDGHVTNDLPKQALYGIDPWNPAATTQPSEP